MIIYPIKPWYDGQEFEHITSNGQTLVATYNEASKTWFYRDLKLNSDEVFTDTVYTVNLKPSDEAITSAGKIFDEREDLPQDSITTQQDVNWYLHDLIETIEGGSSVWVDQLPPPVDETGAYRYPFWFNPVTFELKYDYFGSWLDKGFNRPPIVSESSPIVHPEYPGQPLQVGDLWLKQSNSGLHVYSNSGWVAVSDNQLILDSLQQLDQRDQELAQEIVDVVERVDEIQEEVEDLEVNYLPRAGGNMEGPLILTDNFRGQAEAINKGYVDNEVERLEAAITGIIANRGSVRNYTCTSTTDGAVTVQGQISFPFADPAQVNRYQIHPQDLSGQASKVPEAGDLIELEDRSSKETVRFICIDPSFGFSRIMVGYVGGSPGYQLKANRTYDFYVFPQDADAASKDYVDAQLELKVNKGGDTMTGPLIMSESGITIGTGLVRDEDFDLTFIANRSGTTDTDTLGEIKFINNANSTNCGLEFQHAGENDIYIRQRNGSFTHADFKATTGQFNGDVNFNSGEIKFGADVTDFETDCPIDYNGDAVQGPFFLSTLIPRRVVDSVLSDYKDGVYHTLNLNKANQYDKTIEPIRIRSGNFSNDDFSIRNSDNTKIIGLKAQTASGKPLCFIGTASDPYRGTNDNEIATMATAYAPARCMWQGNSAKPSSGRMYHKDNDSLILSYTPKIGPKFDHDDRKSFDCLMPYTVWELQNDNSWKAIRIGQVNKMLWGLKPSETYVTCTIQTFSSIGSIGSNNYYVTIGGFI